MQNLVSKSKFSEMAGVNPSTITRVIRTILKECVVGRRIDAAHPDAVAYLESRNSDIDGTKIDPLFLRAREACEESGIWTAEHVAECLGIGGDRAARIFNHMSVPLPTFKKTHDQQFQDSVVHVASKKMQGQAAVNHQKKKSGESFIYDVPDDIQAFADMSLRDLVEKFGTDVRFLDWLKATKAIEDINEKRLKNAQTKGELISRELVKNGVIDIFNSAHLRLMKDGAKSIAAGAIAKHVSGAETNEVEAYVSDILGSFIKPVKSKIERILKNAEA